MSTLLKVGMFCFASLLIQGCGSGSSVYGVFGEQPMKESVRKYRNKSKEKDKETEQLKEKLKERTKGEKTDNEIKVDV